jgi:hypothetical protein
MAIAVPCRGLKLGLLRTGFLAGMDATQKPGVALPDAGTCGVGMPDHPDARSSRSPALTRLPHQQTWVASASRPAPVIWSGWPLKPQHSARGMCPARQYGIPVAAGRAGVALEDGPLTTGVRASGPE